MGKTGAGALTLEIFVIKGGRRLSGVCRVSGAKNAVLPAMAASLLAEGPVEVVGAPRLRDIGTFAKLLGILGAEVSHDGGGADGPEVLRITPGEARKAEAPYELVKTMRASVLVLGPLLARYGRARISLPGGCAIGARPIDQHLRGLELMGAKTSGANVKKQWISTRDNATRGLKPTDEFDHFHMDSKGAELDGVFDVPMRPSGVEQLQFPGDPTGSAGNIINCRCTIGYLRKG